MAFLDGELNAAEVNAIEQKIQVSPAVRREIDALQRTWDFLDVLPRPKGGEEFAARTLSFVSQVAVKEDRIYSSIGSVSKAIFRELGWLALAGFLGVSGYAAMRWGWPDRSASLAEI